MALSARTYLPIFEQPTKLGNFVNGQTSTVTQATSRATGVTLNTISGQIITSSASLAAETSATFTVTCSNCSADDVVILAVAGGSNGGNTTVMTTTISAGSFQITVGNQNASGGTAETGAILINYLVMKAAQV